MYKELSIKPNLSITKYLGIPTATPTNIKAIVLISKIIPNMKS